MKFPDVSAPTHPGLTEKFLPRYPNSPSLIPDLVKAGILSVSLKISNLESTPKAKLGEILVKKNWINQGQLEEVLDKQRKYPSNLLRLGEILLNEQIISPEQLNIALQEQYWRRNGFWVID